MVAEEFDPNNPTPRSVANEHERLVTEHDEVATDLDMTIDEAIAKPAYYSGSGQEVERPSPEEYKAKITELRGEEEASLGAVRKHAERYMGDLRTAALAEAALDGVQINTDDTVVLKK